MSALPQAVSAGLERELSLRALAAAPLGGGMICGAARVETRSAPLFVKWKEHGPPRFFALEVDGLTRLADVGCLRVPRVAAFEDAADGEGTGWLALEWIDDRGAGRSRRLLEELGARLARMHMRSRGRFSAFGLDTDNYLGLQPQKNTPSDTWADFYRDCRILPQVEVARRRGLLPPSRERLLMRLVDRLPDLLADMPAAPALIHGDLWTGNLLAAGDTPVVVDPAVYYADREVELAYMQLFSGFPQEVFGAYQAVYPIDPGYPGRRALHQLYPLIIHLNHFGEQYGPDVERVCRTYLA